MPRNGNGSYELPQPAFVPGTTIASSPVNSDLSDIGAALSQSISKDGQTVYTGDQPMGSHKLTGLADGTLRTDSASLGQVVGSVLDYAIDTGAADAYVIAPVPGIADYAKGQRFAFEALNANLTTTPTLAVNSKDAGIITNADGTALAIGAIAANMQTVVQVSSVTLGVPTFALQTIRAPNFLGFFAPPQGRLTLTTALPVLAGAVTGATTIYYTPYLGNLIPLYDGTNLMPAVFAELTNVTTESSTLKAGPAAVTTNSNYDLFVWNDAGTVRLTRGPAWTDGTTRSAGTALVRVKGLLLNNASITNGPAASRGTYVGTVRSDGSSQINWIPGAVAANGTAGVLGVWNMFNRVEVRGTIGDSTDSWDYSLGTWRSAHASDTLRVSVVSGLAEDSFDAQYVSFFTSSGTSNAVGGVGYDSTTTASGIKQPGSSSASVGFGASYGEYGTQMLGFHFFQALEICTAVSGTNTFYGDVGTAANFQSGLTYSWRA